MTNELKDRKKRKKPPDWLIENIAEASKNARKIYFLYIGFLAYCALTVFSTSDRQIILNETARLPIVNLDVSLNGFFILAPVIAILVFLYFQLYLQRIKGLVTDLRSNYLPIEKRRLYPWMINIAEDPEPGAVGILQTLIAKFSLWALLPIVLMIIAYWYVKKHDPILSYVVGLIPIVSTLIVLWFWCHYEGVKLNIRGMLTLILNNLGKSSLATLVIMFEVFLLFFIIPWAMENGKYQWIRPWICVDLSYQKLVTEPEKTDYKELYWVNLNGAHLEGANLRNTILKRADLGEAHLEGANLLKANLQGASLWGADLRGACLWEARLEGADLMVANLQGASLWGADLRGASLWGANLEGSDLMAVNLQEAKNLKVENLANVNTLYGAKLDKELFELIKKTYPHLLEKPTQ